MFPSSLLRHAPFCGCQHSLGAYWGPLAAYPSSEIEFEGMFCHTSQERCDILMLVLYQAGNIWAVFSISLQPAQSAEGGEKKRMLMMS